MAPRMRPDLPHAQAEYEYSLDRKRYQAEKVAALRD